MNNGTGVQKPEAELVKLWLYLVSLVMSGHCGFSWVSLGLGGAEGKFTQMNKPVQSDQNPHQTAEQMFPLRLVLSLFKMRPCTELEETVQI